MNLLTAVNTLKGGGGYSSPITTIVTKLNSRATVLSGASTTATTNLATALTTLCTNATAAVNALMNSIKTQLPILKAADNIVNVLNATSGETSQFTAAYAPVYVCQTQLALVDTALSDVIYAQLQVENVTNITGVSTAIATATAAIATSVTNSNSAIADLTATLNSYGYAKFLQSTKPSYVQDILTQFNSITVT